MVSVAANEGGFRLWGSATLERSFQYEVGICAPARGTVRLIDHDVALHAIAEFTRDHPRFPKMTRLRTVRRRRRWLRGPR